MLDNFVVSANYQKITKDCGATKYAVVRLTFRLCAFKFKAHEKSRQQIVWKLIESDNVTNLKYNTILRDKITPTTTYSDFHGKVLTTAK